MLVENVEKTDNLQKGRLPFQIAYRQMNQASPDIKRFFGSCYGGGSLARVRDIAR